MVFYKNCFCTLSASALMLVMGHINLYLYNPHQTSASYPFTSIDASINTRTTITELFTDQSKFYELPYDKK